MSWIDIVGGSELDRYGVKVDKLRYRDESDADYRVRLKSIPITQNRDDGKAAFPVQGTEMHETWYGMSLRDYFAAKFAAAQSVMTSADRDFIKPGYNYPEGPTVAERIAQTSYQLADAMIAERAK